MCPTVGGEGSELYNGPLVSTGVHSTLDVLVLARDRCIFSLQTSPRGRSLLSFASTALTIPNVYYSSLLKMASEALYHTLKIL